MPEYIDEQEQKYVEYFGEPTLLAYDVITNPHVDVYIFPTLDENYIHITKGMDELEYPEYLMITHDQVKWPTFFLQSLCGYQIASKEEIKSMEIFEDETDIKDANGFNQAMIYDISKLGINKKSLTVDLNLKRAPLYVYPITTKELIYSYEVSIEALSDKLSQLAAPLCDVERPSVV